MSDRPEKPEESRARSAETEARRGAALKEEAVLEAALKDAAFDGFTDSVLAKAGKEAGADKAALARLFPGRAAVA